MKIRFYCFLIIYTFPLFYRKLSQYSPSDTSKAFDRAVTRRSNVKFNPKQTIQLLKLGEPKEWDDEQKLDLVKKYMDVRIVKSFLDISRYKQFLGLLANTI